MNLERIIPVLLDIGRQLYKCEIELVYTDDVGKDHSYEILMQYNSQ